jgi:hypothetical protein
MGKNISKGDEVFVAGRAGAAHNKGFKRYRLNHEEPAWDLY